jgi:N-acyl-D-aspartate/D-glutamate deacylase
MSAPVYRRMFSKQWSNKLASRAYHRDLGEAWIVSCPDDTVAGRTFADVAAERGQAPIDTFLDLQVAYGNDLRWYTVVANGNPTNLESIIAHPSALIGFSDAGAHLRNMAFYNFPLRMLKRVRDAELAGRPFMTIAAAVHKLTADIADFHRIDAGRIARGARADVVVLDPSRLDDSVEEIHEVPMPGFDDLHRVVRRNDDTVRAVFVNGRKAWSGGSASDDLGSSHHYGTFLPSN